MTSCRRKFCICRGKKTIRKEKLNFNKCDEARRVSGDGFTESTEQIESGFGGERDGYQGLGCFGLWKNYRESKETWKSGWVRMCGARLDFLY